MIEAQSQANTARPGLWRAVNQLSTMQDTSAATREPAKIQSRTLGGIMSSDNGMTTSKSTQAHSNGSAARVKRTVTVAKR